MKNRPAIFALPALFCVAAAYAGASRPKAVMTISSFKNLEQAFSAVCTAADQPAAGILGSAAVRAQLVQIGQFDDAAPWHVAVWVADKCEVENPVTGTPTPIPGSPSCIVLSIPVSGASADALPLPQEAVESGLLHPVVRDHSLLLAIDVSKALRETGTASGSGDVDMNSMIEGAEEAFAAPIAHPGALLEFWQDAPADQMDPASLSASILENIPDNPAAAGARKAIEAFFAISAERAKQIEREEGFVEFDPATGFTFVGTAKIKEGSELASMVSGAGTVAPQAFAGIPASARLFFATAPVPGAGATAARFVREVVAPLGETCIASLEDDAEDDEEKAKAAAVRAAAQAFFPAMVALCEAKTGESSGFFALDPAGHAAFRSRYAVTSAEPVSASFAAIRALGSTVRAACLDGDACDDVSIALSDPADATRLEATITSEDLPGPFVAGAKVADGAGAVDCFAGHSAADFSASPAVDATPIFALVSKFSPGARPVGGGAFSLSGILADAVAHASDLDIDEEDAAQMQSLLAGVPDTSRTLFVVGARGNEFSEAIFFPLSGVKFIANMVTAGTTSGGFLLGDEDSFDFADDELDDGDDDDDDDDDANKAPASAAPAADAND